MTRSVKAVQTHLQCQIQKKEVENDELKAKIRTLEKKIAEWKLQAGECKHQILALRQKSEQKKSALKKATRSQKQRAEHFEAVVENITSRIREREVKLSEILSTSNVWKKQHDEMVEEKTMLEIQTEDLKKQITSLLEDLKKKEECRRNSNEEILAKLSSIITVEQLCISDTFIKFITYMESHQVLQQLIYGFSLTFFSCNANMQVRGKMEADLKELEHVRDLLKAAEEKLQEYQENLMSCQKIHAQKCRTLRELQVQVTFFFNVISIFFYVFLAIMKQLEKMEFQNEEFANQLTKQDESLQCSKLQLKEKIAECDGLAGQLESALEEGRKMVSEEMEKMLYKQQALQTKMLVLETELREREEEKKQLLCMFHHHQEVCLKELENSLQKSENKTQSMQNYVEFLKASYVTMFG
uniref:Outer dense fiber of sperm tails 2 like n=1 Tax=Apteryx owenii TaxID=8824 RepID=A0A8B9Q4U6_APTOW